MVTVELIDTGLVLDTLDEKITYVKQVSEIGDVTKLNTSYSWTIRFPKTPTNSITFESLGVVAGDSEVPYRKNYVNVYDNGIIIVRKGLLSINETSDEYKGFVQEGIIEFIRDLSNDEIGNVIDLSDLDHRNDVNTVIDSFSRNDYRYIIADYNGVPLANETYNGNSITNLSPSALLPSINIEYLFNKIMSHYGWTYSGDLDVSNLWMTYPKAVAFDESGSEPLGLTTLNGRGQTVPGIAAELIQGIGFQHQTIDNNFFEYVLGSSNMEFRCLFTGNYKIVWNANGYVSTFDFFTPKNKPFTSHLFINGILEKDGELSDSLTETEVIKVLNQGDIIRLNLSGEPGKFMLDKAHIIESNLSVFELGVQDISFSKALIKYKVKDFFKELMIRGALVTFTDIDERNLHFVNLDNRLSADVVDFSDKFIRRTSEKYLYNDYAQNNYFKHKYDEEGDNYADGNLIVDNENLEVEKELYVGKSHAPANELTTFDGNIETNYFVNRFKMFDIQVKEDPNTGDLIADYKALENRFYFMRSVLKTETLFILGVRVDAFPIASIFGTTYKDVVAQEYSKIRQLIRRTKIHDIELALTAYDVATLELDKVYYIDEEKSYYLINKIKYVSEERSKGEFIKIERE